MKKVLKMTRRKLKTFVVSQGGQNMGYRAENELDLLNRVLPKKLKGNWEVIYWIGDDQLLVAIHKEWIDGGWTIQDCLDDWNINAPLENKQEEIHFLPMWKPNAIFEIFNKQNEENKK